MRKFGVSSIVIKASKFTLKLITAFMLFVVLVSLSIMFHLRWVNPTESAYMDNFAVSAKKPAKFTWVDFEDIHWSLSLAVIAAEDQKFPQHMGLDIQQIRKALKENKTRKTPRGASTITQQTVKNLFLSGKRSYSRKFIEAWLTICMELIVPKKRILEIYLNIAQFGKSTFGAETASLHYFGKSAFYLNADESRLMAASLPTPSISNPAKPSEYLIERNQQLTTVMNRMGKRVIESL